MAKTLFPSPLPHAWKPARVVAALLLAVMAALLFASVRQESQTMDEAVHLFAGIEYWRHADFGRNPEHPPLVKFLVALPLLPLHLQEFAPPPVPLFKAQDNINSVQMLYSSDASKTLLRARLVIILFSLTLGALVFFAGREMFGDLPALFALALFVFEPVLLANGGLVTTDMPLACLFFATSYAFFRFTARPSLPRAALTAVLSALTLASKHSGVLILPTLLLLALCDLLARHRNLLREERDETLPSRPGTARSTTTRPTTTRPTTTRQRAVLYASTLLAVGIISYLGLWAAYGFRYAARPDGLQMVPTLSIYSLGLPSPWVRNLVGLCARFHLLPEAYLFGWVDILLIPDRPSFLFQHVYGTGQWFYLPATFLVKSTLFLLVLLALLPFARLQRHRRELLFLAIPAAFYLVVGMLSRVNMGVRHILPVYPFCLLLAAVAAVGLARRSRLAQIAVAAGLLLTVVSSLHAYPDYLAYSNEAAGGPSHTYQRLTDSNADWGQNLQWIRSYLDAAAPADCWIDYANPTLPLDYFGIHCRPLPNGFGHVIGAPSGPIPPRISGTVLLSSTDVDGLLWGPDEMNPYALFRDRQADAMIGHSVLVYHGTFDVPLLAAQSRAVLATTLLRAGRAPDALGLAQAAAAQAPDSAEVNAVLGQVLLASGQPAEGQQRLAKALQLAQTVHPDYQQTLTQALQHPQNHP